MKKFTKIVATVSDLNCESDFIAGLFREGMNVVRMNSAHLDAEGMERIVRNVRKVSGEIALMIDTKGPEIRTTPVADDSQLNFLTGMNVEIVGDPDSRTSLERICLNYRDIAEDVVPGAHILIDDGELDFVIDCIEGGVIHATSANDGVLGSRKTVNIPGVSISLPSVSDRDKKMIEAASRLGIDFVAHSFVRSADDVRDIKRVIAESGGRMEVISKIENQQGIDNIVEIINESYGIMVARGDLGIEVPAERIPAIQSRIIKECVNRHKPVIVATQMLHSMINSPRPTRAEVTDVASAVAQRADAVMLSGETAKGRYPLEAVRTMAAIAGETERSLTEDAVTAPVPELADAEVTSFLARQAVIATRRLDAQAILTDTYTGRTARYIASFRGHVPTFAICYQPEAMRLLALSYGVEAITVTCDPDTRDCLRSSIREIVNSGKLSGDVRVAYIGGPPAVDSVTGGAVYGATFLEIDNLSRITHL